MDELERAVLIQLDPTKASESEVRQAQAYTTKGSPSRIPKKKEEDWPPDLQHIYS